MSMHPSGTILIKSALSISELFAAASLDVLLGSLDRFIMMSSCTIWNDYRQSCTLSTASRKNCAESAACIRSGLHTHLHTDGDAAFDATETQCHGDRQAGCRGDWQLTLSIERISSRFLAFQAECREVGHCRRSFVS